MGRSQGLGGSSRRSSSGRQMTPTAVLSLNATGEHFVPLDTRVMKMILVEVQSFCFVIKHLSI